MAETFIVGDRVEILMAGQWDGPYIVTAFVGRTPDHLVLRTSDNEVYFEHYNDAPYNTRKVG